LVIDALIFMKRTVIRGALEDAKNTFCPKEIDFEGHTVTPIQDIILFI
jgi:hypothetical protein